MALGIHVNLLPERHPLFGLILTFIAWKAILLCVAFTSPGPGYDTSTTLLDFSTSTSLSGVDPEQTWVLWKLVRWDAIYYTSIAQRGHLFEQDWAFGIGLSRNLSWTSRSELSNLLPGRSLTVPSPVSDRLSYTEADCNDRNRSLPSRSFRRRGSDLGRCIRS